MASFKDTRPDWREKCYYGNTITIYGTRPKGAIKLPYIESFNLFFSPCGNFPEKTSVFPAHD
jgi:hypothetical protein